MNVSPAQRLVSYLREFPLARPAPRTEPAQVEPPPTPPTAAAERPVVAERRAPAAPPATVTATSPPPSARLPRGSLLNIVT